MTENRRIVIFDTTLRDGEQSPGASMNLNEKMEIAQALVILAVVVLLGALVGASIGQQLGQRVKDLVARLADLFLAQRGVIRAG